MTGCQGKNHCNVLIWAKSVRTNVETHGMWVTGNSMSTQATSATLHTLQHTRFGNLISMQQMLLNTWSTYTWIPIAFSSHEDLAMRLHIFMWHSWCASWFTMFEWAQLYVAIKAEECAPKHQMCVATQADIFMQSTSMFVAKKACECPMTFMAHVWQTGTWQAASLQGRQSESNIMAWLEIHAAGLLKMHECKAQGNLFSPSMCYQSFRVGRSGLITATWVGPLQIISWSAYRFSIWKHLSTYGPRPLQFRMLCSTSVLSMCKSAMGWWWAHSMRMTGFPLFVISLFHKCLWDSTLAIQNSNTPPSRDASHKFGNIQISSTHWQARAAAPKTWDSTLKESMDECKEKVWAAEELQNMTRSWHMHWFDHGQHLQALSAHQRDIIPACPTCALLTLRNCSLDSSWRN